TAGREASRARATTASRILRCPRCTPSKFPMVTIPARGRSDARKGSRMTCIVLDVSDPLSALRSLSRDDRADEVIFVCLDDPDTDNSARPHRPTGGVVDQETAVDLGRLRTQPPFEQVIALIAGSFDEGLDDLPAESPVLLARDRLLKRKKEGLPPL